MKKGFIQAFLALVLVTPVASFGEGKICGKIGPKLIKRQAITSAKLVDGTIQPDDFKDGSINSDKFVNFIPVPMFVLAVGTSRDIYDNGSLKLTAKCENTGTKDRATVIVTTTTDGAIVQGYRDVLNILTTSPESDRWLHFVEANTAALGNDPARRFHAIGADGSIVQSSLYVAVNVRSLPGCHFGGLLKDSPASN
jgi:hypothetical protein